MSWMYSYLFSLVTGLSTVQLRRRKLQREVQFFGYEVEILIFIWSQVFSPEFLYSWLLEGPLSSTFQPPVPTVCFNFNTADRQHAATVRLQVDYLVQPANLRTTEMQVAVSLSGSLLIKNGTVHASTELGVPHVRFLHVFGPANLDLAKVITFCTEVELYDVRDVLSEILTRFASLHFWHRKSL